jgi:hypothetical protein
MMMGKLQAEGVQIAGLYSKTQKSYPIVSKRLFGKFSTGNFYLREQGTGNRDWEGLGRIGKDWEGLGNTQKTIKSSPLPLQGEG